MRNSISVSSAFLLLGLAACSPKSDNPVTNAVEVAKDPALQGKVFESSCRLKPVSAIATGLLTGSSLKSSKTQYQFKGASLSQNTIVYQSSDCSGDAALTLMEAGTFNVMTDKKTPDDARYVDISYSELKVVINSPGGATVANGVHLCGHTDWAVNQEREVTAKSKEVNCYNTQVPRNEENVYRLEEGTLYLGSTSAGKDEKGRPTAIDRENEKYVARK